MSTNDTPKANGPTREELLKALNSKPQIYKDALKYAFYRWRGISFLELFEEESEAERVSILAELRQDDFFNIVNDPKDSSEVRLYLTEKGRDSIVALFYSQKEQRLLKRLFKKT